MDNLLFINKILIFDKNLVQKAVLRKWLSFTFSQKLNTAGSFSLTINANDKQAQNIQDGYIVYISDEICGYINYTQIVSQNDKAGENLVITGIELKDVIKHRVIVPESGLENVSYVSKKTGFIVEDLITNSMINPTDIDRKISNMTIVSSDLGTNIDYSARYKMLDTEVYSLLAMDSLGIKTVVDLNTRTIKFAVFQGVDRTYTQTANTRAIFSLRLNTIRTANTILDSKNYKTMGYIGGEGKGIDREIIQRFNDDTANGLDRKESFIDVRDAKSTAELISSGDSKMLELNKIYSISGETYDNGKNTYSIGDIVTVEDNFGNMDDVQITSITYTYTGLNPATKAITFGKAPDTIAQAINKRLSGLNNILTN